MARTPTEKRCLWCDRPLHDTRRGGSERLYCSDAHRAAYKRAERAANLGELVERLGPHVNDSGIEIYRELVGHLAGRVNADI